MKLKNSHRIAGFTLSETLVSLSLSSIVLAAAVTAGVSLQKSLNAVDNYFATHMQQVRIIDYLSRDVNRGLSASPIISHSEIGKRTRSLSYDLMIVCQKNPDGLHDAKLSHSWTSC